MCLNVDSGISFLPTLILKYPDTAEQMAETIVIQTSVSSILVGWSREQELTLIKMESRKARKNLGYKTNPGLLVKMVA